MASGSAAAAAAPVAAATAKYALLPPRGISLVPSNDSYIYGEENIPNLYRNSEKWERFQIDDSILANPSNPYHELHKAMNEVREKKAAVNAANPAHTAIHSGSNRAIINSLEDYEAAAERAYKARNKFPHLVRAARNVDTSDIGLRARFMRALKPTIVEPVTALMAVAERSQGIHHLVGDDHVAKLFRTIPHIDEDIAAVFEVPRGFEPRTVLDQQRFFESKYSIAREVKDYGAHNATEESIMNMFRDPTLFAKGLVAPSITPVRAKPEKLFHLETLILLVAIAKLKNDKAKLDPEVVKAKINQLYDETLSLKAPMSAVSRIFRPSSALVAGFDNDFALMLADHLNYDFLNKHDVPYDILFEGKTAHIAAEIGQAHFFLHHGVYIGNNIVVDVWNRMFSEDDKALIESRFGALGAKPVSTTRSESTVSVRSFDEFLETSLKAVSPVYLVPYNNPYPDRIVRRRALWSVGRFPHYNIERESCESHAEWVFDNNQDAPRFCMLRGLFDSAPHVDHPGVTKFFETIFTKDVDVNRAFIHPLSLWGGHRSRRGRKTRGKRRSNRKKTHRRRH